MQHAPAISNALGRYEATTELARGRTTRIIAARRRGAPPFSKVVALKVLTATGDRVAARILRREALLAARLEHPAIASVHDFEDHDGVPFAVMELVRGVPLSDLITAASELGEPVPAGASVAIALALADALHHVHEARSEGGETIGMVHRAVRPDNVMVSLEGWTKLIDFGACSTVLDQPPALTPGDLGACAAPELRSTRRTDRRADVYALGVVLRELLALGGGEVESAGRPLLARAAALDASTRFPSAADLGDAIEAFAWRHRIARPRAALRDFLDLLLRRATDEMHERATTEPLPGLDRAMASRQPVAKAARTRIRLRRLGRPIPLH